MWEARERDGSGSPGVLHAFAASLSSPGAGVSEPRALALSSHSENAYLSGEQGSVAGTGAGHRGLVGTQVAGRGRVDLGPLAELRESQLRSLVS